MKAGRLISIAAVGVVLVVGLAATGSAGKSPALPPNSVGTLKFATARCSPRTSSEGSFTRDQGREG